MYILYPRWRVYQQVARFGRGINRLASTSVVRTGTRHLQPLLANYRSKKLGFGSLKANSRPKPQRSVNERLIVEPEQLLLAVQPLLEKLRTDFHNSFTFSDLNVPEKNIKSHFEKFRKELVKKIQHVDTLQGNEAKTIRHIYNLWQKDRLSTKTDLYTYIKKTFYQSLIELVFTPQHLRHHVALADFRYPMETFPSARRLKRTIHLHVGPTNSGKTYHALKRLREAKGSTLYAGPLRMLAQEIYARMNATGKPTWLVTGDDKRPPTDSENHDLNNMNISCTVEMAPHGRRFEVAVIDEIQMLADPDRGCHWTNALLGICADEVHLCGEERAVSAVQKVADSLGEELVIHRYTRLTKLEIMDTALPSLSLLEKGDCIVAFSVKNLHKIRDDVERVTGKRCAIVYGALPAEVRTEQSKLFNDPDNDYDYLVASDAIGMGLNLAIKRVIFYQTSKRGSEGFQQLKISDTKQIGGRAGRYRTSYHDTNTKKANLEKIADVDDGALDPNSTTGYVTAFKAADLAHIKECFESEPDQISQIGFQPTSESIMRFYSYFPPGIPYSLALIRLADISQLPANYFLNNFDGVINIADAVEKVKNLRLQDRIQICFSPAQVEIPSLEKLLVAIAQSVAAGSGGGLLDLPLDLDVLDIKLKVPLDRTVLTRLEELHKGLVLYSWMSFRFPSVFVDRALANEARSLTQAGISQALALVHQGHHHNSSSSKTTEDSHKMMNTVAFNPTPVLQSHARGVIGRFHTFAASKSFNQFGTLTEQDLDDREGDLDRSPHEVSQDPSQKLDLDEIFNSLRESLIASDNEIDTFSLDQTQEESTSTNLPQTVSLDRSDLFTPGTTSMQIELSKTAKRRIRRQMEEFKKRTAVLRSQLWDKITLERRYFHKNESSTPSLRLLGEDPYEKGSIIRKLNTAHTSIQIFTAARGKDELNKEKRTDKRTGYSPADRIITRHYSESNMHAQSQRYSKAKKIRRVISFAVETPKPVKQQ